MIIFFKNQFLAYFTTHQVRDVSKIGGDKSPVRAPKHRALEDE